MTEPDAELAEQLARLEPLLPPMDYTAAPGLEIARALRARAPAMQFPAPEGVLVEDHRLPVANGAIAIRRYLPRAGAHGGALLYLHGGGWVLGTLDSDELRCRAIAVESGCQIFSVDYRLAPEFPFPVPAEDCFAALQWLGGNAARFGVDRARIGIAGSSAGGNLAAAVTLMARDRGAAPIAFQLLIYPVCDPDSDRRSWRDHGARFPLTREDMLWFWDQYAPGDAARDPLAAVLRAPDLSRLPPAHIVLGDCDLLHDEGLAYAERLRASGVPVTVADYAGMVHGFLTVAPDHPTSRRAIGEIAAILRRALGRPGAE